MLYTGTLMTENAFYPLFVLAALLLVLTLERPTALRQVLLLAVCGVAFATRAQAIALFGAALVAPLVQGLIERDLGRVPRRFATLYGLTAVGAVLALVGTVARGRSPLSLLGAYRAATDRGYSFTEIARYFLWHTAELDLAAGRRRLRRADRDVALAPQHVRRCSRVHRRDPARSPCCSSARWRRSHRCSRSGSRSATTSTSRRSR